jgi:hypothetical protein
MLFIENPSPLKEAFERMMCKIFHKSCDFDFTKDESNMRLNNAGGYSISGVHGIGKSSLLRICTVLSSFLLNNVVSVYVDTQQSKLISLSESLYEAFQAIGINPCNLSYIQGQTALKDDSLHTLLGYASMIGWVVVLCINEISDMYTHTAYWTDLHKILNCYNTALFISDSTWKLQTLIECEHDSIHQELTLYWYGISKSSLNNTKISNIPLYPLTTMEQYIYFLHMCAKQGDILWTTNRIRGLHTITAGRISDMYSLLFNEKDIFGTKHYIKNNYDNLPHDKIDIIRYIIDYICSRSQSNQKKWFDPFELPHLSKSHILKEIQTFGYSYPNNQTRAYEQARRYPLFILHDMLLTNILTIIPSFNDKDINILTKDMFIGVTSPYTVLQSQNIQLKVHIINTIPNFTHTLHLASFLQKFGIYVYTDNYKKNVNIKNDFTIFILSPQILQNLIPKKEEFNFIERLHLFLDKYHIASMTYTLPKNVFFVCVHNLQCTQNTNLVDILPQNIFMFNIYKHTHRVALVTELFGRITP